MDKVATIKDIVANFGQVKEAISKVKGVKDSLIDLCLNDKITEQEFYMVSSLLTPQSRSPLWENYFMAKHGCEKVSSKKDAGDFRWQGRNYEYKASCNDDGFVNIVQVRLWQNCDYVIQVVQPEHDKVYSFRLSHDDMTKEMKLLKATSAHGTKTANLQNKNRELRATVIIGSKHWERWIKNYLFLE